MDRKAASHGRRHAIGTRVGAHHGAICRYRFLGAGGRTWPRHRCDHQRLDRARRRSEASRAGLIQSGLLRVAARPLSARKGFPGRPLCVPGFVWKFFGRSPIRLGVRPAARHQADADAAETDPRCLRRAGAGCAIRAVHLFGGAANSEIAAGRVHGSLRAHLDEPSAGPRLGVSQALNRPARPARQVCLNAIKIMPALKILVIPGSVRTGSLNVRLAATAAYEFAQAGAEVTRISLGDFPLPIYDGDLQTRSGVPKNAINLKRMIGAHHGVLIVTPEYNSSVPPLVQNTIDWATRVQDAHETRGQGFRERAFAIAAASESRFGGARSLAALRLILTACHATGIPNQRALAFASEAYDDSDRLNNPADIPALNTPGGPL